LRSDFTGFVLFIEVCRDLFQFGHYLELLLVIC
jgi:hypothetical protein